jgi:hypothetical protein
MEGAWGPIICVGAFFGARALARRLMRLPSVHLMGRTADDDYFAAGRLRRVVFRMAGPLATYAIAVLLIFVALRVSGKTVATMTVDVIPDGPAARAGMEPGDRIVSVDGVVPASWDDVPRLVSGAPAGKPLTVRVRRGESTHDLVVRPDETRKILISSRKKAVALPARAALSSALARPFETVAQDIASVAELWRPAPPRTLEGPVGIAREAAASRERGNIVGLLLMLLAFPTAHWWPLAIVGELLLWPRRRR